jgi:polyvinyl alcohol dehydrogenase (cytochrome)
MKILAQLVGSWMFWLCLSPAVTLAALPSGEAVYQRRCAGCHEQTNPRIPPRQSLMQMPASRILRTLDFGAMMTVAYPMSRDEREAVAGYLGTNAPAVAFPQSAYCSDRSVTVSSKPQSAWNGWSPSTTNARYQSAADAGLSIDQVPRLKLKWAFGFDGDVTAFGSRPSSTGKSSLAAPGA